LRKNQLSNPTAHLRAAEWKDKLQVGPSWKKIPLVGENVSRIWLGPVGYRVLRQIAGGAKGRFLAAP
jgi:hypothetical protein